MASLLTRLRAHPTGFWFVFWGELAERASFYGMRTLLALYLVEAMRFDRSNGAAVMQFFLAACYLAPLLGGWLADRWLGRFRTIMVFAGPYIVGQIILGAVETRVGLFVALPLLALGSGAIKPNTSTLMGLMYEEQKKGHLLGEAFSYFYAAINVGSAIASLSLPLVRNRFGYGTALGIPAALMTIAFVLFALGRRHYPREEVHAKRAPSEPGSIRRLFGVFALVAVFWFVYDQTASTWIFFARDRMDLALWPGARITPDQVQGLNPVFILVLTPVFNTLWQKFPAADTRKMTFGFWIVTAAMGTMAIAGYLAAGERVSVWWEIAATFVITLGELCISVVGLEFAFRRGGAGAKSAVTAAFLLTVFVGDSFGGVFDQLYERLAPGPYFALQAAIVAAGAIAFRSVASRFETRAPDAPAASYAT